eukprot:m.28902 g.28902  ORF g.28902 m.28902 type:complete len:249 (+) comp31094_c0_seq2:154-900(+)
MLLCRRQNSTVTVHLFARHFSSGKFSNRKNPEKARRRAVLTEIARKSGDLNKYAIDTKGLDRPITTRSVGQIVNEYTPPERGYRASLLSKKGWLQRWEAFKMKLVTTYSIGIIKRYAKPFKVIAFAKEAEKLFSEVNTALASSDKKSLLDLTTENAYQGLRKEYHNQKVSWTLVSTVRRPKVVHARVIPVLTKENYFAQVTVRLHTTQVECAGMLALFSSAPNVPDNACQSLSGMPSIYSEVGCLLRC